MADIFSNARAPRRIPAGTGQAALELAIILPVLIILLAGVMLLGPLVYTNLAVSTAAGDCVTAAAQTLDPQQGRFQGIAAAQESLAGFRIR